MATLTTDLPTHAAAYRGLVARRIAILAGLAVLLVLSVAVDGCEALFVRGDRTRCLRAASSTAPGVSSTLLTTAWAMPGNFINTDSISVSSMR